MPRVTQDTPPANPLGVRDSHPLWCAFPSASTSQINLVRGPTTPVYTYTGLAYSAFARHYSQNVFFSSRYLDVSVHAVPFPRGMTGHDTRRVSPFGHLWLLTAAHA